MVMFIIRMKLEIIIVITQFYLIQRGEDEMRAASLKELTK